MSNSVKKKKSKEYETFSKISKHSRIGNFIEIAKFSKMSRNTEMENVQN